MMDYSMNLNERKDFILGYNITKEGMIKVKFAKGKPWYVPYNEENEKKILDKMKKQLEKTDVIKKKIMDKVLPRVVISAIFFASSIILGIRCAGSNMNPYVAIVISSLPMVSCLIAGFSAIKNKIKLNDLEKNIKFLEMEKKLNDNVRSEKNVLINVSNKTKKAIREIPEDRPVFNINSLNDVSFSDLEQIVENIDRNERFGFVYDEPKQVNQPKTKKRKR